jgi:hypothetical protein
MPGKKADWLKSMKGVKVASVFARLSTSAPHGFAAS